MSAVLSAIAKAFGQLGDRAVVGVAVKSIAVTLAVFAVAGAGLYLALDRVLRSGWVAAVLPADYAAMAAVLVWLVVGLLAF